MVTKERGTLPGETAETIGYHLRRSHGYDVPYTVGQVKTQLLSEHERIHGRGIRAGHVHSAMMTNEEAIDIVVQQGAIMADEVSTYTVTIVVQGFLTENLAEMYQEMVTQKIGASLPEGMSIQSHTELEFVGGEQ